MRYRTTLILLAAVLIAGTVALLLAKAVPSAYDADIDGEWDPSEVEICLETTANHLKDDSGTTPNNHYGYGLINAYNAVTAT